MRRVRWIGLVSMDEGSETRFIVWAEAEAHPRALIMTDLPAARLFDDIVATRQTRRSS